MALDGEVARQDETVGDTIEIGSRIREIRTASGMSLRKLSRETGISVGFLSQVERGLSSIALSRLQEISTTLGCSIADFFEDTSGQVDDDTVIFTLTRGADRKHTMVSGGRHYELLSARAPGLVLEPMVVYIEPNTPREEPTSHAGEEFAYVLRGTLIYEVAGVEHELFPGDSIYLRSNALHTLVNRGDETCVVVSVVTPRHY